MSNITIIAQSGLVQFETKQGISEMTAEGALFKGGAALAALKDVALEVALSKATNGKYRAAADILGTAFASQHKAFEKCHGVLPWANKSAFASYLGAMENAKPGKSGEWNKKQTSARTLMRALRSLPAFKLEGEIVDAVAEALAS